MKTALQRCDRFVARTMNWLYDHLRNVRHHKPIVLTNNLLNRREFPELEAWEWQPPTLPRRVWRRLSGGSVFPLDRRRLSALDPVVLHSHFGYVGADDQELASTLDVPWVVSFYGADVFEVPNLAGWKERYSTLFDQVTSVLALGPYMADRLEGLGCPRGKIHLHPLGVDVEALPYKPRERREDEPLRILFAGTFREKKGVPYLLQAIAALHKGGAPVRLDLVGEAAGKPGDLEMQDRIFRLIDELDLSDIVTHRPFQPFGDLLELAMNCHVLAAPSVTAESGDAEGTPFVIQQMMATGMPVVSTEHSDIPYIFGSLRGLLVPERDSNALKLALERYVESPSSVREDARLFRNHVETELNVVRRAERLSEIYDQASVR